MSDRAGRKGGGLRLGLPADRISLCDIYRAATSEKRIFARGEDIKNRCRISAHFNEFFEAVSTEAEMAMLNTLAGRNVADCLQEALSLGQSKKAKRVDEHEHKLTASLLQHQKD